MSWVKNFSSFQSKAWLAAVCFSAAACSVQTATSDDEGAGFASGSGAGAPGATSGATTVGGQGAAGPNVAPTPPLEEDPEDVACNMLDDTKPLTLYVSADDSNSMASPALAREMLTEGFGTQLNVRTYEFLNYFRIEYEPAAPGDLNLIPQLAPAEDERDYDLQIGVRSFDLVERRPMTLTLVLDTSGSMGGIPIARERAVVRALASSLAEGDIVNAVIWDTGQATLLDGHIATGPNDAAVVALANSLEANGGTNLDAGLVNGYELAKKYYGADRLNRVVLVSDGGANVGTTEPELIGANAKDSDQEGIYLVGVGTGPAGGYSDQLMDVVTDAGRGAYVYIDSEDEAEAMFGQRFAEVMEVAARAVQVELTLPWYFQMHRFYGEEYSENPEEVDPQHLAPGDAMIFNQVLRACDPAIVDDNDTITVRATWTEPMTYVNREKEVTVTVGDLLTGSKMQLLKGRAIVAFAEALKTNFPADLQKAMAAVDAADPDGEDAELTEIADLIRLHPAYQAQ